MSKKETGVVRISGRDYTTVAKRVKDFREAHPHWTTVSEIVERNDEVIVMRSSISDETGRVLADGYAEEFRKASQINKTSAVENCETSSLGRALAKLGYGGTEFASANEVEHAKDDKPETPAKPVDLEGWAARFAKCTTREGLLKEWELAKKECNDAGNAEAYTALQAVRNQLGANLGKVKEEA